VSVLKQCDKHGSRAGQAGRAGQPSGPGKGPSTCLIHAHTGEDLKQAPVAALLPVLNVLCSAPIKQGRQASRVSQEGMPQRAMPNTLGAPPGMPTEAYRGATSAIPAAAAQWFSRGRSGALTRLLLGPSLPQPPAQHPHPHHRCPPVQAAYRRQQQENTRAGIPVFTQAGHAPQSSPGSPGFSSKPSQLPGTPATAQAPQAPCHGMPGQAAPTCSSSSSSS
jgi:hypothetical protein